MLSGIDLNSSREEAVFFLFFNYVQQTAFFATRGDATALRYSLMLGLMSGIMGLPFAEDLEDLIDFVATKLKRELGSKNPKTQIRMEMRDLINQMNMNPDLLLHGFADGDGDRLGVVTKDGEIIYADRQLMLLAKDVLSRNPGAEIIYDVKSTRLLPQYIERHGGKPLIWKTGHSLIKAKLKETGALLAGEMSGHTFFKERWYGFDDALYGGARLLEVLSKEKDANQTLKSLPNAPSTPSCTGRWRKASRTRWSPSCRRRKPFPGAERVVTIDGVRVEYADGFGLARASNTTPTIVMRFEADTPAALERIKKDFRAALQPLKPNAPLPY